MGFADDMDKVSAVLNCAWKKLQGKDCWKPQYDFSPELLLAYYLGFFRGRACKGGLCMPISNYPDPNRIKLLLETLGAVVKPYLICIKQVI